MTDERMDELFARPDYTTPFLGVCVGSWKAYNERNEFGLGTCWKGKFFINFLELDGAEELEEVLKYLGWSDLTREELFVQDYESDFVTIKNCDYEDPRALADLVAEHHQEINDDAQKLSVMQDELCMSFKEALDHFDDYQFYPDCDGAEYEQRMFDECTPLPDELEWLYNYIDWESMARNERYAGGLYETKEGVLVYC